MNKKKRVAAIIAIVLVLVFLIEAIAYRLRIQFEDVLIQVAYMRPLNPGEAESLKRKGYHLGDPPPAAMPYAVDYFEAKDKKISVEDIKAIRRLYSWTMWSVTPVQSIMIDETNQVRVWTDNEGYVSFVFTRYEGSWRYERERGQF